MGGKARLAADRLGRDLVCGDPRRHVGAGGLDRMRAREEARTRTGVVARTVTMGEEISWPSSMPSFSSSQETLSDAKIRIRSSSSER